MNKNSMLLKDMLVTFSVNIIVMILVQVDFRSLN